MYAVLFLALVAAEDGPVKPLASAPWTHARVDTKAKAGSDAKQVVLDSAAGLVAAMPNFASKDAPAAVVEKQATEALAKALKVKEIDWTKQMLIIVTGGSQRSGGFRVEVTEMKAKDGTLTVSWKLNAPKGLTTAALTHPGVVVLVPKHAGKVVFDPPAKKE